MALNTRTRTAGQDQFQQTLGHGLEMAQQNRTQMVTLIVAAVVLIAVIVGGYGIYQHRTNAAATAFGAAMQTYQTPVAQAGQPVPPGMKTFPDTKTRAAEANRQFLAVADQYGSTEPGKLARYFAGLTYMEEGQNASAEQTLKQLSGSFNGDVASLAKLALAQLYQQTGRDADAAPLFEQLAKSNSTTVPSGLAMIQQAEMYDSEGKTAQANKLYAEVKDKDKDAKGQPGPAGEIATQKLGKK